MHDYISNIVTAAERERGRKHKQRKGNFKRKRALGKGQMFYAASYCTFFPSTYVPALTFPFFPYYFVFLSNCLLSLFSSHRSAIYYLFLSFHTTLSFSICLITLFPLDLSGFCFFLLVFYYILFLSFYLPLLFKYFYLFSSIFSFFLSCFLSMHLFTLYFYLPL